MACSGLGTSAAEFLWAVGIENTFVPHTRAGHRRLDEYELMDHYRLWRQDLDLAADLGISAIRYGIPWYRVNPRPGVFDWSWTDPVLEYLVDGQGADADRRPDALRDAALAGQPLRQRLVPPPGRGVRRGVRRAVRLAGAVLHAAERARR